MRHFLYDNSGSVNTSLLRLLCRIFTTHVQLLTLSIFEKEVFFMYEVVSSF